MQLLPADKFTIAIDNYSFGHWHIPAIYGWMLRIHDSTTPEERRQAEFATALQAERAYVACEGLKLDAHILEGDITDLLKMLRDFIQQTRGMDMPVREDLAKIDLVSDILDRILPKGENDG